jgi:histone-binding protein RBBP4
LDPCPLKRLIVQGMETENAEEHLINEEYKIWKKNTPFLYDLVLTKALEWPSLTVEWLPERRIADDGSSCSANLLLGTHTSDAEQNFLMVAEVRLPHYRGDSDETQTHRAADASSDRESDTGETGYGNGPLSRIEIRQKINHDGEVNRARYWPKNPFIVATKSPSSLVYLYDLAKLPSKPPTDGRIEALAVLTGHQREGFGLSWSPNEQGGLLSCADDMLICHYDVHAILAGETASGPGTLSSSPPKERPSALNGPPQYGPLRVYTGHKAVVEDVAWCIHNPHLFISVGDDRQVMLWDTRDANSTRAAAAFEAHKAEVNCAAFSPFSANVFATGSNDCTVAMWDVRYLKMKMHSFEAHTDAIQQLAWSPTEETILASAGADRRLMLWDLSRIGQEQSAEDAEDGPPELVFVHGGHTAKISDFGWSQNEPWLIASVAEDNILQVWQVGEHIYAEDDDSLAEVVDEGSDHDVRDKDPVELE